MSKNKDKDTGLDLDKIINGLSEPGVGENANSILGLVKEANVLLSELTKSAGMLNSMGILTPAVRIISAKVGVDIDKPLPGNMAPASDWHKMLYDKLNTLDPDTAVAEMVSMGKQLETKKTEKVETDASST